MPSLNSTIWRAVIFGVAVTLGVTVMGGVASAAPSTERGKGSDQTITVTEDNDTNDNTRNNVADDGDNAHPSGKDRSVEHGGSGNQGKASHDPDDDGHGPDRSNGGADHPGADGGVDLADQDGNNGCGNDDDFEDDNEGWCGKPTAKKLTVDQEPDVAVAFESAQVTSSPALVPVAANGAPVAIAEVVVPEVLADSVARVDVARPAVAIRSVATEFLGVDVERSQADRPTEVLGVSYERGVLARTGIDHTVLILIAVALVAIGVRCKRFGRTA